MHRVNKSGTFPSPSAVVGQAGLPLETLFVFSEEPSLDPDIKATLSLGLGGYGVQAITPGAMRAIHEAETVAVDLQRSQGRVQESLTAVLCGEQGMEALVRATEAAQAVLEEACTMPMATVADTLNEGTCVKERLGFHDKVLKLSLV